MKICTMRFCKFPRLDIFLTSNSLEVMCDFLAGGCLLHASDRLAAIRDFGAKSNAILKVIVLYMLGSMYIYIYIVLYMYIAYGM